MSTGKTCPVTTRSRHQESILNPRQRSPAIHLPEDPAEEELARNWTLSPADRVEVLRCRGDNNRRLQQGTGLTVAERRRTSLP
jgi:hypothetical protein